MHGLLRLSAVLTSFCISSVGWALPIGFGETPANQSYYELRSKNFYVYHDQRAQGEAQSVLNTLEHARPHLERWFLKTRRSPLPVIMSATTANASFANFITDAIEIQSLGQAPRDLVLHEYVHSVMYRHFLNWLGPAGSVLHLIWLPSWFVEGLAEALSVSSGSDVQALIERYHATTKRWPTYDQLHSLYNTGSFGFRGYATAGAFVSYILRNNNADQLPQMLRQYYMDSMPWYWPYSLLPLKQSLPLDSTLVRHTKQTGEEHYRAYKLAAEEYWAKQAERAFSPEYPKDPEFDFSSTVNINATESAIFATRRDDLTNELNQIKLKFGSDGWARGFSQVQPLPEKSIASAQLFVDQRYYAMVTTNDIQGNRGYALQSYSTPQDDRPYALFERQGFASQLIRTQTLLVWQEQHSETTRVCTLPIKDLELERAKPTCPITARHPIHLEIIGKQPYTGDWGADRYQSVWIKKTEQGLARNKYLLIKYSPDIPHRVDIDVTHYGEPISIAHQGNKLWLLSAERNQRSLRLIDNENFNCEKSISLGMLLFNLVSLDAQHLGGYVFNGDKNGIYKFKANELPSRACGAASLHTSPIIVAMAESQANLNLSTALAKSNLWASGSEVTADNTNSVKFTNLHSAKVDKLQLDETPQPAKWRGRPVVGVPWLGADADGLQLAFLSVPLMDHMQNEQLRAYFGYGLYSRYPNTELSFSSNRHWFNWQLDGFRYQTWDGRYFHYFDPNHLDISNSVAEVRKPSSGVGEYRNAYLDEQGFRLSGSILFSSWASSLSLGVKSSFLRPYIGHYGARSGQLVEPFISLSKASRITGFNFYYNLSARAAPKEFNKQYDYNVLGAAIGMSKRFHLLSGQMNWQLSGSRTRGEKRRELQEVYRPLKTFVAGSGEGYNNLNFPISGDGMLFSARYADTRAKIEGAYTVPIVKNIDKLIRIFYWDALNFTAYTNLGTAWNGTYDSKSPRPRAAHGYELNSHFDIKGVNFNLGGGIGQVFGYVPDLYASFSFDAVF